MNKNIISPFLINRKRGLLSIFITLILFTIIYNINAKGDSYLSSTNQRDPSINIILPQNKVHIQTGHNYDGTGHLLGNVTILKPSEARMETVIIELYIEKEEEDLTIEIIPNTITFSGGGDLVMTEKIKLDISVDPILVSSYINGLFTISGYWYYQRNLEGGVVNGIKGEVIIIPYTDTNIFLEEYDVSKSIPIGSWESYELEIVNRGNCQVQIVIEVACSQSDIIYYIDTPKLLLDQGESNIVNIRIKQEGGIGKINSIQVNCSTIYKLEKETDEVTILFTTNRSMDEGSLRIHIFLIFLLTILIILGIFIIKIIRRNE